MMSKPTLSDKHPDNGRLVTSLADYLANYGENEAKALHHTLEKTGLIGRLIYTHALVIPVYKENTDCFLHYMALSNALKEDQALLLILVLNQNDQLDSPDKVNQDFFDAIKAETGEEIIQSDDFYWKKIHCKLSVLVIDRFSKTKIPIKQGVGLARKIGLDIACQLYCDKTITNVWIANTDADAFPDLTYFDTLSQQSAQYSAQIFHFTHQNLAEIVNSDVLKATQRYEISLHYYFHGLQYAQSPYAFYSIGSVLGINLLHYAMARGYPKRAAGEDFYLLNKLRKLAPIAYHASPVIPIHARESDRVPFGTGPMVTKLMAAGDDYPLFYDPACFQLLKILLDTINQWSVSFNTQISDVEQVMETVTHRMEAKCQHADLAISHSWLTESLHFLKLDAFITHCLHQLKTSEQVQNHWLTWFDGFKTLKYVHYIRDNGYPSMCYQTWIEHPFIHKHLSELLENSRMDDTQ